MRSFLFASALAIVAPTVLAQQAGFVAFTVAGLGSADSTSGVVGESRLPVRASDVVRADDGRIEITASSARASLRQLRLGLTAPTAGARYGVGEGATILVRFASGNERAPDPGRGWIEVEQMEGGRLRGTFEATFHQGRIPIDVRGRFEVPLP